MPRLQLWQGGQKNNDYHYFDRIISEYFGASGTAVYVHLYLGVHDQREPNADGTPLPKIEDDPLSIQDVLFLENRDRKYSKEVFELRGVYTVQDNDFNFSQFGLFLTGDTLFIQLHYNDMVAKIGRKIMAGDVIELPHQREEDHLDPDKPAMNKFYVVEDASRSSEGYSATWFNHIWRIKVTPMQATQEFQDILDKEATNPLGEEQGALGEIMSTLAKDLEINEAVIDAAKDNVKRRYFETQHIWIMPGEETGSQYPWIYTGDGIPPNGRPAGTGNTFPQAPEDGEYFLRTDYTPNALFRYMDGKWRIQELDYRRSTWSVANALLYDFINNEKKTLLNDGTEIDEKQGLSGAVKPRADF